MEIGSIQQQQQQQQAQQQTSQQSTQNQHTIPQALVATQFISAWDDLARWVYSLNAISGNHIQLIVFRATAVATSTVKTHVVSVLQDFVTQSFTNCDQETEIRDHNQQIIMETTQTMINIQHQFCVASYDSFSTLMCCFMCQAPVGFPHDSECGFQKRHLLIIY